MMEVAKAQQTSPLLSLPDELLWKIARELLVIQNGDVVDCYCLAAFSLTCRRIAQATRTALFLNVPISSEAQLESLGAVPEHLLNNIRHLMLYLDSSFLHSWRTYLDESSQGPTSFFAGPAIFITFARILSQTPHLRSLSFKVAESIGPSSVWRKFGSSPSSILSLEPIQEAFALPPSFHMSGPKERSFPEMTALRVDGFEGLGPLLRMCPNLQVLDVLNSGGFDNTATEKLLRHIRSLPHLKSLAFSPNSIARATSENGESQHSAGLVKAIGKAVPSLERLSLQTRWLGYGVFLVPLGAEAEDIIDAVSVLPNLTHLYLPVSLQTSEEILLFKEWRHPPSPSVGTTGAGGMRALLEQQRRLALDRAEERELSTIGEMQERAPRLGTVAWVRFAHAHICNRSKSKGKAEVSVEYRFDDHVDLSPRGGSDVERDTDPDREDDLDYDEDDDLDCGCQRTISTQVQPPRVSDQPSEGEGFQPSPASQRKIQISVHDADEGFDDARSASMWISMHLHALHQRSLSSQQRVLADNSVSGRVQRLFHEMANAAFMLVFVTAVLALLWEQSGMSRVQLISNRLQQ